MRRPILFLFCMFFWMFSSCKSQDKVFNNATDGPLMELILQDDYSGAVSEELLLIQNQKSLQSFFANINKTRKPGFSLPNIDFSTDMLLVWCAGESTATSLGLKWQEETSETFVISKLSSSNKGNNSAVTSPFYIYKLPWSDKKLAIE